MSTRSTVKSDQYRKTCKRYNEPGDAHALTFSCFQRKPFLTRERSRAWVIKAIVRAKEKHRFDVWAYVLMPEHVHLLIYPRADDYSISDILRSIKLSVSTRAIRFVEENKPNFLIHMEDAQPNGRIAYRFWQRGGGYDRNLRSPKYIWETIDYFHANPVRRGLCQGNVDWLWSSARSYAGMEAGLLSIDTESLPDDPRRS